MDLFELRDQIDDIDGQIVHLIEERMKVAENVARYKIGIGKPVYDGEREKQKIAKVKASAENPKNANGIESVFRQLMASSRMRQYELIAEEMEEDFGFMQTDAVRYDLKVAYQGAAGAYGHQAVHGFFGENCDCYHVPTFEEVMREVALGRATYGVLPVENTSTGIITDVYDLMNSYDNYIVGEYVVKVEHALLVLPDAEISDIRTVYSHPQGLMQCTNFLNQYPDWNQVSLLNTAVSAKKVSEDQLKGQAAVASALAGKIYGLKILEPAINNNDNNSTKFIIVQHKKVFVPQANEISITFELAHETGSLYYMLGFILHHNLNMTKIESRPIPGEKWRYRFFIDFEGNLNDRDVIDAIKGIQQETQNFKILGNYVRAE